MPKYPDPLTGHTVYTPESGAQPGSRPDPKATAATVAAIFAVLAVAVLALGGIAGALLWALVR